MNTIAKTDAWFCSHCWERHEIPAGGDRRKRKPCPDCGEKLHRVSRYEWFLEDALSAALEAAGADYKIRPQFPIEDHRGFTWYWDHWIVPNDLCKRAGNVVYTTAAEIATHMLGRAQTQC